MVGFLVREERCNVSILFRVMILYYFYITIAYLNLSYNSDNTFINYKHKNSNIQDINKISYYLNSFCENKDPEKCLHYLENLFFM